MYILCFKIIQIKKYSEDLSSHLYENMNYIQITYV